MVSHERIYQHVWQDKKRGGTLNEHLRTRGKRYRAACARQGEGMARDCYAHVIGVDTSGGEPRSIRLKVTALLPRPVAPVHPALRLEVVAEHAHGSSLHLHRHRPGHGLLQGLCLAHRIIHSY
jgi:hypothetical protein